MSEHNTIDTNSPNTKMIGGYIPIDLYWLFKETQVRRKENATQALINAIRLYNELEDEIKNEEA